MISSGSVRWRVATVGLHIILAPPKLHVQVQIHDHVIAVISLSVRHVQTPSRKVVVLHPVTQVSRTTAAWAQ
jgi:hypothetical protein